MEGIVKHLKKGDVALKTQCANALFKVCPTIIVSRRNLNLNHLMKGKESQPPFSNMNENTT